MQFKETRIKKKTFQTQNLKGNQKKKKKILNREKRENMCKCCVSEVEHSSKPVEVQIASLVVKIRSPFSKLRATN